MIANDQSSNPEFLSQQSGRRPAMFDAQLFTIKNAVIQLRNAYNGHDVEWADVGTYSKHLETLLNWSFVFLKINKI